MTRYKRNPYGEPEKEVKLDRNPAMSDEARRIIQLCGYLSSRDLMRVKSEVAGLIYLAKAAEAKARRERQDVVTLPAQAS